MTLHPNVHAPWQQWSNEETLHVAVAYSNPFRWRTRREILNDFRHQLSHAPNVRLYVGELAYGDRPFEVTTPDNPLDVQLRASSELFHKENIQNEVIRRFPPGWKYGACSDGDFTFTRHDWALEAIHMLQHHAFVQLFSTYAALSAKTYGGSRSSGITKSFAATYVENGWRLPTTWPVNGWPGRRPDCDDDYAEHGIDGRPPRRIPIGAVGAAWAFRRDAFDRVGGLLDCCILGHADWFMAFGLVAPELSRHSLGGSLDMNVKNYHPNYVQAIASWQARAAAAVSRNVGVVDQFAVHHFHGSYKKRGYGHRDMILVRNQFDPLADIRRNWQGIYELTGNKPRLRDDLREHFISRDEDNPNEVEL